MKVEFMNTEAENLNIISSSCHRRKSLTDIPSYLNATKRGDNVFTTRRNSLLCEDITYDVRAKSARTQQRIKAAEKVQKHRLVYPHGSNQSEDSGSLIPEAYNKESAPDDDYFATPYQEDIAAYQSSIYTLDEINFTKEKETKDHRPVEEDNHNNFEQGHSKCYTKQSNSFRIEYVNSLSTIPEYTGEKVEPCNSTFEENVIDENSTNKNSCDSNTLLDFNKRPLKQISSRKEVSVWKKVKNVFTAASRFKNQVHSTNTVPDPATTSGEQKTKGNINDAINSKIPKQRGRSNSLFNFKPVKYPSPSIDKEIETSELKMINKTRRKGRSKSMASISQNDLKPDWIKELQKKAGSNEDVECTDEEQSEETCSNILPYETMEVDVDESTDNSELDVDFQKILEDPKLFQCYLKVEKLNLVTFNDTNCDELMG